MCCGRRTTGNSTGTSSGWEVTYPDGKKEIKDTEVAARMAVALVPGSRYEKKSS